MPVKAATAADSPPVERSAVGLVLAAAASIFFWASAYPAIQVGLRLFSPGELAAVRFLVAALCFVVLVVARRPALPTGAAALRVVLAGVFGIAAYNLLLNTGEQRVSAGAASFLINCMPVFAALLGLLLGERLRPLGWVGVAVSFAGVGLIAVETPGGFHATLASLLVLAAAGCAAIMGFLQKPLLARFTPIAVTACIMWTGALLLAPFLPRAFVVVQHAAPGTVALPLATAVYLGIFPAALGYITWAQVLTRLPLGTAASVLYLIPPVTLVVSFFWLGERVSLLSLAGGALAIAGVILLSGSGRRPKKETAAKDVPGDVPGAVPGAVPETVPGTVPGTVPRATIGSLESGGRPPVAP